MYHCFIPCLSVQLLAAINDFYMTPNVMKIPGREEEGGRENRGEEEHYKYTLLAPLSLPLAHIPLSIHPEIM